MSWWAFQIPRIPHGVQGLHGHQGRGSHTLSLQWGPDKGSATPPRTLSKLIGQAWLDLALTTQQASPESSLHWIPAYHRPQSGPQTQKSL